MSGSNFPPKAYRCCEAQRNQIWGERPPEDAIRWFLVYMIVRAISAKPPRKKRGGCNFIYSVL